MGAKTIPNVQKLLTFHRRYCGNDDILILNGLFFIGGAPNEKEEDWKNNVKQIQNSLEPTEMQPVSSGIYYCHDHALSRVRISQEKPIRSIQDYFNLNLSLLVDSRQCSLPGYKSHDNIIFGSTPVIMRGCTFNEDDEGKPSPKHTILLGDNVRIERIGRMHGLPRKSRLHLRFLRQMAHGEQRTSAKRLFLLGGIRLWRRRLQ